MTNPNEALEAVINSKKEPEKSEEPREVKSLKTVQKKRTPVLNQIPMDDLKRIMKDHEISAGTLEKELGLEQAIVGRCLRGEIYMDDDIAEKIAKHFGVTMFDIRQKGLAPMPQGKVDNSLGNTIEKEFNGQVFEVVEEGGDFLPVDNKLKCRKVMDKSKVYYDGYTLSFEEQVIILTGVKYNERFRNYLCFALPEAVIDGEVFTDPQLFNVDGELAVAMRNLGINYEIEVGKPIATFRKMLIDGETQDFLSD